MSDFEGLIQKLKSTDANARYEACEELRVAPSVSPEALAALRTAAEDPNAGVADAARRALALHAAAPPSLPSTTPQTSPWPPLYPPPSPSPTMASMTPSLSQPAYPPQPLMPSSPPNTAEYVFALERRVMALEYEFRRVSDWAAHVDVGLRTPAQTLPNTALVSPSFLSRAFAVWGHYLIAQLLIAVPIYLLILLLALGS